MTKEEVINHFGSVANLARALKISTQAIYDWGSDVPEARQYQIQVLTNGELKASATAA
jgi:transcriptional repressor of cell division inhibition gene dicB